MYKNFRYGLPVNFQAILLHPNKKSQKRLRDVLNQLYSHLDGSAAGPTNNSDVSAIIQKNYYYFYKMLNYYVCFICIINRMSIFLVLDLANRNIFHTFIINYKLTWSKQKFKMLANKKKRKKLRNTKHYYLKQ